MDTRFKSPAKRLHRQGLHRSLGESDKDVDRRGKQVRYGTMGFDLPTQGIYAGLLDHCGDSVRAIEVPDAHTRRNVLLLLEIRRG